MGSDYDGRVAFYVVGTSPFESIEQLEEDRKEKDLPWPVAYPDEGMLESLGISSQASKIAIGGGRDDNSSLRRWQGRLRQLARTVRQHRVQLAGHWPSRHDAYGIRRFRNSATRCARRTRLPSAHGAGRLEAVPKLRERVVAPLLEPVGGHMHHRGDRRR